MYFKLLLLRMGFLYFLAFPPLLLYFLAFVSSLPPCFNIFFYTFCSHLFNDTNSPSMSLPFISRIWYASYTVLGHLELVLLFSGL